MLRIFSSKAAFPAATRTSLIGFILTHANLTPVSCVSRFMKYVREFARQTAEWSAQILILILIFTTTTLAMPCVIPSASMESTLMTGDHVIVDKLAYGMR